MRYAIAGLSMLLGSLSVATPAMAQVSVSVSIPGVSIGIHQPSYPDLVLVPGSPVYYAPQAQANYFFYDGLYWVFQDDNWYVSSWYNGPWDLVEPDDVPLFVLRVPVQYYVRPPVFFHTWIVTAPPRWHFHWGPRWTRYHHGWDHWDRHAIPAPAPLPVYQRHYHGERYPHREYQRVIRHEHYHYQPRDQIVRRHEQQRMAPRHAQAYNRPAQQHGPQFSSESRQEQRPQRDREDVQRSQRDREQGQRWPGAREEVQRSPAAREEVQRSQRSREEAQRSPAAREDGRQSESRQLVNQQPPQPYAAPAQAQRPQRVEAERQVRSPVQPSPAQQQPVYQAPVNQAAQNRPDIPRPQRAAREREPMQRMEAPQMPPQQRAAVMPERPQQQQRQEQAPRAQQAPRPQQAQGSRGDTFQPRAGAEQRQGPRPERGQDRGRDRGQGRG